MGKRFFQVIILNIAALILTVASGDVVEECKSISLTTNLLPNGCCDGMTKKGENRVGKNVGIGSGTLRERRRRRKDRQQMGKELVRLRCGDAITNRCNLSQKQLKRSKNLLDGAIQLKMSYILSRAIKGDLSDGHRWTRGNKISNFRSSHLSFVPRLYGYGHGSARFNADTGRLCYIGVNDERQVFVANENEISITMSNELARITAELCKELKVQVAEFDIPTEDYGYEGWSSYRSRLRTDCATENCNISLCVYVRRVIAICGGYNFWIDGHISFDDFTEDQGLLPQVSSSLNNYVGEKIEELPQNVIESLLKKAEDVSKDIGRGSFDDKEYGLFSRQCYPMGKAVGNDRVFLVPNEERFSFDSVSIGDVVPDVAFSYSRTGNWWDSVMFRARGNKYIAQIGFVSCSYFHVIPSTRQIYGVSTFERQTFSSLNDLTNKIDALENLFLMKGGKSIASERDLGGKECRIEDFIVLGDLGVRVAAFGFGNESTNFLAGFNFEAKNLRMEIEASAEGSFLANVINEKLREYRDKK